MNLPSPPSLRLALTAIVPALCHFCGNGRVFNCVDGLTAGELDSPFWIFCGRAAVDAPPAKIERFADIYIETISGTTDFFAIKDDSVLWTGYNTGRRMGLVADSPVSVSTIPVMENAASPYSASGTLDVSVELKETGRIECRKLASGSVVIAPGDTLKGVSLTRTVQTRVVSAFDVAQSDTICIETLRWTIADARVPIAVQRDGVLYVTDNQELVADAVENDDDEPYGDMIRDLLDSAVIELSGGQLRITLDDAAAVHIYVMDVTGNIYRSAAGNTCSYVVDVSGLPHNTYIISIVSDELPEITLKSIAKI